jgi:ABC-2 type transport system ATP-binding protein
MNQLQDIIIDIKNLDRQFAEKKALDNVSLQVTKGQVFGIVGENGAGKTTLIKHILGLYKAQQGSVSVFGLDPVKFPKQVLSRIGYLSEEPDLPDWMTIPQFMNYMSAFYPSWDHQYANQLIKLFDVEPNKKIKQLSKGQKARIGLCAAQAHRPDLLLLDEPSSGLDPIVRKEILTAVIRTVVDEGRTVILSSHLLDEIERVCDHLVMFSKGKVLLSEPMETVLQNHFKITVRSTENQQWDQFQEIYQILKNNDEWELHCFGVEQQLIQNMQQNGIEILDQQLLSLNEIFLSRSPHALLNQEVT